MAVTTPGRTARCVQDSLAIATDVVDRNPMRGAWLKGLGESHAYIGFIDLARGDLDDAALGDAQVRAIGLRGGDQGSILDERVHGKKTSELRGAA